VGGQNDQIHPAATAYGELVIRPKPVGDLRYVRSSYPTPQGLARSSWTKTGRRLDLKVTIPTNTTAEVWLPDGHVTASARAAFDRSEGSYAVFTVPSGTFTFTASSQA